MNEKTGIPEAPESVRSVVQRATALIAANDGSAAIKLLNDLLSDPDFPREPEIDTWPAWAESIRTKLAGFGVYDGSEDEIDLAEDFSEWIDGFESTCRHEVQVAMNLVKAAAEALAPFAAVSARMDAGYAAFLRKDQPETAAVLTDAELAEFAHPGTSNILSSGEMRDPALATMGDLRLGKHVLDRLLKAISLAEVRNNLLESAPDDSVLFAMVGNPNILAATLGPDIEALKAIALFHRQLAAKHLDAAIWTSEPGKEWHGEQQTAHARYADLVDKLIATCACPMSDTDDRANPGAGWVRTSQRPAVGGTYLIGGYVTDGGLPRRFSWELGSCILTLDGPSWSFHNPAVRIPMSYYFKVPGHPERDAPRTTAEENFQ